MQLFSCQPKNIQHHNVEASDIDIAIKNVYQGICMGDPARSTTARQACKKNAPFHSAELKSTRQLCGLSLTLKKEAWVGLQQTLSPSELKASEHAQPNLYTPLVEVNQAILAWSF